MQFTSEALTRIIAISRKELRQVWEESGGIQLFEYPETFEELHAKLPLEVRDRMLPFLEDWRAAVAATTTTERIIIHTDGCDPFPVAVDRHNPDLSRIDRTRTRKQKAILEREALYRHLIRNAPRTVAVVDRETRHLDCNFTLGRIGMRREDVIGKVAEEIQPTLADFAHTIIGDAFRHPEVTIRDEFTMINPIGIPVRYRIEVRAFGDEAICLVDPVSSRRLINLQK